MKRTILKMICEEDANGEKPAEVRYDGDPAEIFSALSGLLAIFAADLIANGLTTTEVKKLIETATEIAFVEDVSDYPAVRVNGKKSRLQVLRGGGLS